MAKMKSKITEMKSKIVMSLGGSILVPDEINIEFLKEFRKLILEYLEKGNEFIIVCGGGKTCRKYQKAATEIFNVSDRLKDWIGIYSTWLNAMLVKAIFGGRVEDDIAINPTKKYKGSLVIGAGWQPGHSTDNDAVLLAKTYGAGTVINLSDLDFVYDKDPKKFKDAKPLKNISWAEMRRITGEKWVPGRNVPFDPSATKEAEKLGLKVILMKGTDLKNLRNFFDGKNFKGTVIE